MTNEARLTTKSGHPPYATAKSAVVARKNIDRLKTPRPGIVAVGPSTFKNERNTCRKGIAEPATQAL